MRTEESRSGSPRLRKARVIRGRTLVFRDAAESDAEFILSLRTNSENARFLSATSVDIESQLQWLRRYAASDDQAYFIVESGSRNIGTVRLYDARGDSFCWGSWILVSDAPNSASIESALMVYAYAVDELDFRRSHFDVRKANKSVWRFHERFGAERVAETEKDFFYQISLEAIRKAMSRYRKYLPLPLAIE